MAFNWFISWISKIIFSYANTEDKKQGRKKKRKKKIPISKECNGPCDSAQTLADPFRTTCKRFQYNRDNGKIALKISFFGKEFNLLLAVCLHNFADNSEKQGQDLKKGDKGSSNLCQDIFEAEKQGDDLIKEYEVENGLSQEICEAEKQGDDLIKECEVEHGLSQENKIEILKDWELTESIYSSNSSYVSKDSESTDSSDDSRRSGVLYRKN